MRTEYNIDKMFTYLKGYLMCANMTESLRALQFAREKHQGQFRKEGTPYIIHPLKMAFYAVALEVRDDNLIATILLHDVVEDCNVLVSNLPFNDTIKTAVKLMTIKVFPGETKEETKKKYFRQLLESKYAVLCKAFDRYDNLCSMAGILENQAIKKNINETNELLLPVLKEAKEKWMDLSNILFILRQNIRGINDSLYEMYVKKES